MSLDRVTGGTYGTGFGSALPQQEAGSRLDSATDVNRNDEDTAPPFGSMPYLTRRESSFRLEPHSATVASTADLTADAGLAENHTIPVAVTKQKRTEVQGSDRYGLGITYKSESSLASLERPASSSSAAPPRTGSRSVFGEEVDRLMKEQSDAAIGRPAEASGFRRESATTLI